VAPNKSVAETIEIPNLAGRVPVANGDAADHEADAGTIPPTISLRRRLLNAQKEVAKLEQDVTVEKVKTPDGKTFGGYKGISAAQVVSFAKSVLVKHGIFYTPEVDQKSIKNDGNKTTFWVNGIFENIDDPTDMLVRGFLGTGTDKADQGASKAFTNANKQILAKVLQMSTVDVKEDEPVDYEPEGTKAVLDEAKQNNDANLRSWAASLKAALEKATSVDEIDDLQSANRETLMSKSTPQATRDYFIGVIQKRKALLGGDNA
jgi:hypothetical protein